MLTANKYRYIIKSNSGGTMTDKNYITATQSAIILKDHIDKRHKGSVELFCAITGNDIRNTKAMLEGTRGVSEGVLKMITKRSTKKGKTVKLGLKKYPSYYFKWEPIDET
jgi:hypothetical protein